MKIKSKRWHFWEVIIEEWATRLELSFDDVDAYELLNVALDIIYQKETWDWWEASDKINNYVLTNLL